MLHVREESSEMMRFIQWLENLKLLTVALVSTASFIMVLVWAVFHEYHVLFH